MKRFLFLLSFSLTGLVAGPTAALAAAPAKAPNIIILFADDMGYGDVGVFGHPTIRTPNLDRMATEGLKLTQFNVAVGSCRPSRTTLLTGRYSARVHPTFYLSAGNCVPLPERELTLPEALKTRGYATAMTGKWHLSPPPEEAGFDRYYDVARDDITTRRSTDVAREFMRENQDRPFFFLLSYYMPHIVLRASPEFRGKSARGLYGDTIEEIDWSVGEILAEVKRLGIAENTFVFFTSDNGPWFREKLNGGTAGLLRGAKGTTWEGGVRGPTLASWPGTIRPGTVSSAFVTSMDLYMTCLGLAGATAPDDLIFDGRDRRDVFVAGSQNGREEIMIYYLINRINRRGADGEEWFDAGYDLRAARLGPWKAHFITTEEQQSPKVYRETPLLFNLDLDPSEKYDVAADHPEIVRQISDLVALHVRERDEELARHGIPMAARPPQ